MPLTAIQETAFRILRDHRNPDSHVAGASALHRVSGSPRYSEDIDIFHDAVALVADNADADAATLRKHGFRVEWTTRREAFCRAVVGDGRDLLKMEWAYDSAFRFFPVETDPLLGYRLHQADLAVNKILAAAGRSVARDFLGLMFLHESYLSIGALAWAATGKDPGLSPLFILNELVRTNRYRPEDFATLRLARPVSLGELKQTFLRAIRDAEELIDTLPQDQVGCLYLNSAGRPVTPDPRAPEFGRLRPHCGTLRGSWPKLIEGEDAPDAAGT